MKKYLIPIIAMLLASCEQNSHAQNPIASQAPTANAECKNLHKVVDIDDLLYQMYSNMDSHCLFEMPTAELEQIWGIKIFEYDYTLPQAEQPHTYPKEKQINNLFTSDENATFLKELEQFQEQFPNTLFLKKSTRFANNQSQTKIMDFSFFSMSKTNGKLPKPLPPPNEIKPFQPLHYAIDKKQVVQSNEYYSRYTNYFWYNNEERKSQLPVLNIQIGQDITHINAITFFNHFIF